MKKKAGCTSADKVLGVKVISFAAHLSLASFLTWLVIMQGLGNAPSFWVSKGISKGLEAVPSFCI